MSDQDLISFFKSSLSCTICLDFFKYPHTIKCGHTFCGNCLQRWLENVVECPICRSKVCQEPVSNLILTDQVEKITQNSQAIAAHRVMFRWNKYIKPTIKDETDGILRCLVCHWEILDDECQCTHMIENIDESDAVSVEEDYFDDMQNDAVSICNCGECMDHHLYMIDDYFSDDQSEDFESYGDPYGHQC